MFQKISRFILEVKQEMLKVSWPNRQELKGTTIVVIVMTIILSLFVFGIDKILQLALDLIF